jgi:hypothetical protein
MWHFTRINYLCYLGVRLSLKWRQWVSLKCGLFSLHIPEAHVIHEMCVCMLMCVCSEQLCEEKTMPLLHEAVALYSVCIVYCEVHVAYVTVIQWSASVKMQMQCFMVQPEPDLCLCRKYWCNIKP